MASEEPNLNKKHSVFLLPQAADNNLIGRASEYVARKKTDCDSSESCTRKCFRFPQRDHLSDACEKNWWKKIHQLFFLVFLAFSPQQHYNARRQIRQGEKVHKWKTVEGDFGWKSPAGICADKWNWKTKNKISFKGIFWMILPIKPPTLASSL